MGRKAVPATDPMPVPAAFAGSVSTRTSDRGRAFARDDMLHISMAVVSLTIFAGLLADVLLKGGLFGLDRSVNAWAVSIQSPPLTLAMVAVGLVFDPYGVAVVMLAAAAYIWFKGSRGDSRTVIIAVLLAGAFIEVFKFAIQRERPLNMITGVSGYSFPSGHATMAAVFFGSIICISGQKGISKFWYRAVLAASTFLILLMGFDRIYLNVHWLSDVLGGYAAGTFALSAAILVRACRERRTSPFVGPAA